MARRCASGVANLISNKTNAFFVIIARRLGHLTQHQRDKKSRVLQIHIRSVKVRRIAHPQLGHGKDDEVPPGVTKFKGTRITVRVARKPQARVLEFKYV